MRLLSIPYYRSVFKIVCFIVFSLVMARLTLNAFLLFMVLMGVSYSMTRKSVKAMLIYSLFPLFAVFNGFVFARSGIYLLAARVGTVLMAFAMMLSASSRRGNMPPFGMMFLYLAVAAFCSTFGYAPLVSYLKIINVIFFVGGIILGVRGIERRYEDLMLMRATMMAIACFIIIGSLMTLPFPHVAYYTSLESNTLYTEGAEAAAAQMMNSGRMHLFGGMLNQSQALAPIVALLSGWLFCDMLFIEKRPTLLHLGMLAAAPFMLYMTRSRTGLLSYAVMLFMVLFYCTRKIRIPIFLKNKIRPMIQLGIAGVFLLAVVSQIRNGTLTKWIMKGNEDGSVSMVEGFTHSRMGKVEENLYDFKRNPLLGSGFQVNQYSATTMKTRGGGFGVFSAPVEKSIVPLMVLGETGIVGAIVFAAFLISFYGTCLRKRYLITLSLFTVYLATNMAEATIFSPSGAGGIEWIITIVGGFTLDMLMKAENSPAMVTPYGQNRGR